MIQTHHLSVFELNSETRLLVEHLSLLIVVQVWLITEWPFWMPLIFLWTYWIMS